MRDGSRIWVKNEEEGVTWPCGDECDSVTPMLSRPDMPHRFQEDGSWMGRSPMRNREHDLVSHLHEVPTALQTIQA